MTDVLDDTASTAIRNYLLFLEDPAKLIDQTVVEQLQIKAQAASDPLDRLMTFSELERVQRVDDSAYKLDFILHAKSWAEANNVSPTAFRQVGVKDEVLRSAGLLPNEGRRGRAPQPVSARPSVSAEMIKTHVSSLRGRFTLADIRSAAGGSPMTVRKAVQELIAAGTVTRIGSTPGWSGRGRAPIIFEAS